MQITDKAVLVKFSVGKPGNSRKDKPITEEVKSNHNLGEKAGRWLKQLYPDTAFEPLHKLETEARTFHYTWTLPWSDEGSRILPTASHQEYCDKMRGFKQAFEGLVESHFIARLPEWEAWARQTHNGTFDASAYMNAGQLRNRFRFTTEFTPIPSGDDFRVNLSIEEMAAISSDLDNRVAEAVAGAVADLFKRLSDPVKKMSTTLADNDAKFKDSLIGNIREILAIVPALNVTSDPALAAFAAEIESALAPLVPETLRHDQQARWDAAQKAKDIATRMAGYLA